MRDPTRLAGHRGDPALVLQIQRQNLTMGMNMRRLTRLTNALSKKLEDLQAAVAVRSLITTSAEFTGRCA